VCKILESGPLGCPAVEPHWSGTDKWSVENSASKEVHEQSASSRIKRLACGMYQLLLKKADMHKAAS